MTHNLIFENCSFVDLFDSITPGYKQDTKIICNLDKRGVVDVDRNEVWRSQKHSAKPMISRYMNVKGDVNKHQSFTVEPSPRLRSWIFNNMLKIDCDTINFNAVVRDNGEVLITANYDQILGSRWLTIISKETFPGLIA